LARPTLQATELMVRFAPYSSRSLLPTDRCRVEDRSKASVHRLTLGHRRREARRWAGSSNHATASRWRRGPVNGGRRDLYAAARAWAGYGRELTCSVGVPAFGGAPWVELVVVWAEERTRKQPRCPSGEEPVLVQPAASPRVTMRCDRPQQQTAQQRRVIADDSRGRGLDPNSCHVPSGNWDVALRNPSRI